MLDNFVYTKIKKPKGNDSVLLLIFRLKDTFGNKEEKSEDSDDSKEPKEKGESEKEYVTSDCISLSPEQWSNFIVKADSPEVNPEEQGEQEGNPEEK